MYSISFTTIPDIYDILFSILVTNLGSVFMFLIIEFKISEGESDGISNDISPAYMIVQLVILESYLLNFRECL